MHHASRMDGVGVGSSVEHGVSGGIKRLAPGFDGVGALNAASGVDGVAQLWHHLAKTADQWHVDLAVDADVARVALDVDPKCLFQNLTQFVQTVHPNDILKHHAFIESGLNIEHGPFETDPINIFLIFINSQVVCYGLFL